MKRKQNKGYLWAAGTFALLLIVWQIISTAGVVERFMLPSPLDIAKAIKEDFPVLMEHTQVTIGESMLGLLFGILAGFLAAVCMDRFWIVRQAMYPLLVVTQTIPVVAIAPLLVLWLGYDMAPKIVLVVISTFFPIAVGLLTGFESVDPDAVHLFRAMGAGRWQIFFYIKLPVSLEYFFSGLRVSASYAVAGAVISEWIGGFRGLGVYMTRVKQAYAFDKMFAVIVLVSVLSLLLMAAVSLLQRVLMPWQQRKRMQNGR